MSKLLRAASRWRPAEDDAGGVDKRALLEFLLKNAVGHKNAISLRHVAARAPLSRRYTKEAVQQNLIVPLRREGKVFIGTGPRGIYLLENAEDAEKTLAFYTTRIRTELRHLRNLKQVARRSKVFAGYASNQSGPTTTVAYFDESGTPTLADSETSPFFIVCGILVESKRELKRLDKKLKSIATDILHLPADAEIKSNRLSRQKYVALLRELGPMDFQWAAACFIKAGLTGPGFQDAATFYRYAYQFLVGDLLSTAWASDLYFDEYSEIGSTFEAQFKDYLQAQNAGLPPSRIQSIAMLQSHREPLLQLADILAGVVKNCVTGSFNLLDLVDEKLIQLRIWPPH